MLIILYEKILTHWWEKELEGCKKGKQAEAEVKAKANWKTKRKSEWLYLFEAGCLWYEINLNELENDFSFWYDDQLYKVN